MLPLSLEERLNLPTSTWDLGNKSQSPEGGGDKIQVIGVLVV